METLARDQAQNKKCCIVKRTLEAIYSSINTWKGSEYVTPTQPWVLQYLRGTCYEGIFDVATAKSAILTCPLVRRKWVDKGFWG